MSRVSPSQHSPTRPDPHCPPPSFPLHYVCSPLCAILQEVSTAEARAYAEEIGALFIETSAKSNKGVQDVFVDISHRLPQPQDANFGDVADLRDTSKKGEKKDKGCC